VLVFKHIPYNQDSAPFKRAKARMCEFNVIFNGKTLFKDVVYAKVEGNNVTVKSVLGEAKLFQNCQIIEVDVNSARLVLEALKS
jgi:predicted RNA-binding protein